MHVEAITRGNIKYTCIIGLIVLYCVQIKRNQHFQIYSNQVLDTRVIGAHRGWHGEEGHECMLKDELNTKSEYHTNGLQNVKQWIG